MEMEVEVEVGVEAKGDAVVYMEVERRFALPRLVEAETIMFLG